MHTYCIILTREPEGGYTILVPAMPGCITYGDTIDEVKALARESIEGYIDLLKEQGEVIPDDNNSLEYSLMLTS